MKNVGLARPENMIIYYGYLNSYDSAHLQWNNEKVAQALAEYPLCVFGSGIANSLHPDFVNTTIIINRIKELNSTILIYGYVQTDLNLSDFKSQVNDWDALGVQGIFLDRAGYDFGTNRVDFNARVAHIRSKSHAKSCFVNAWNEDHVVGINEDTSFPNATFNPDGYESLLNENDFYLLESFVVNTTAYTGGFAPNSDWLGRGRKSSSLRKSHGVKVASVDLFANDDPKGLELSNFSYYASLAFGIEYHGTATSNYGADAQIKYWKRPVGSVEIDGDPVNVVVDGLTPDTFLRFGSKVKLVLTYSDSVHTGQIVTFNI